MGRRRIVRANGVEICLETSGDPADPTLLLIGGAGTTLELWPEPLVDRLVAGGRQVVRYDLRDTGESTTYGAGGATYTVADLTDDAIAVLDVVGIEQADLVGMSLGGGIAQLVALSRPDRVRTLTLIATSPAAPRDAERDLPSMAAEDLETFGVVPPPNWADADSVVEHLVALERICAAKSVPFDAAAMEQSMRAVVERSRDPAAMENHYGLEPGTITGRDLTAITTPTLVLHGDEDPVYPLPHGEALAAEIPGARLQVFAHVGHEMPERIWAELADAVLAHTHQAAA